MEVEEAYSHPTYGWTRLRLIVRYFVVFIRLYLGAWMLLNGLNHFVPIFPQPMGGSPKSSQLMVTLIETGLFDLVKGAEIIVGVMLLLDLFVPVASVLSMPVSVVVWYNHAILSNKPFDLSMGIGCLVWNIFLLVAYLPYFLPMVRLRAHAGRLADFNRLGSIFESHDEASEAPESTHRNKIALVGLALAAMLAYRLHPQAEQAPGSGQTPATIVKEYMNLAYNAGERAEAERMYFSPELAVQDRRLVFPEDGQPRDDKIVNIVAQGSNVAVYHRIVDQLGKSVTDMVDMYRIEKSRVIEHIRVNQESPIL